jgi:hypothetical protein
MRRSAHILIFQLRNSVRRRRHLPRASGVSPVKAFESEGEMYRWRDSIWEVIGRACRGQN